MAMSMQTPGILAQGATEERGENARMASFIGASAAHDPRDTSTAVRPAPCRPQRGAIGRAAGGAAGRFWAGDGLLPAPRARCPRAARPPRPGRGASNRGPTPCTPPGIAARPIGAAGRRRAVQRVGRAAGRC